MSEFRPVKIEVRAEFPHTPDQIGALILNTDNWPKFAGWGPLPGIRQATFERRTDAVTGSVIRCVNTDNSTHTETITAWDLPFQIRLRLDTFSRPLSRLATHFDEAWVFEPIEPDQATRAVRSFELYPTSQLTRPLVWLISKMLIRAVRAQTEQLARGELLESANA